MGITTEREIEQSFRSALKKIGLSSQDLQFNIKDTIYSRKVISVNFYDENSEISEIINKLDTEMIDYSVDVVSYTELYTCNKCNRVTFVDYLNSDGVIVDGEFYCSNCIKDKTNESLREDYLEQCSFEDIKTSPFKILKYNAFSEEDLNKEGYVKLSYAEYGLHFKPNDMTPEALFKQEKDDKFEKYVFLMLYENPYEVGFELYGKKRVV